MAQFILGRKGRMAQLFTDAGRCIPVTILEAGPCTVTQVKSVESDGYAAVQLAYEPIREKLVNKPLTGHFKKTGATPCRILRETRVDGALTLAVGATVACDVFEKGQFVDVAGIIKGRGTAGVMKRHGFKGRPASHGHMCQRRGGSIGMHSEPARVFPGKKMAGHYGATRQTTQNLEIIAVDKDRNLLLVRGAVPGHIGGLVMIRSAKKRPATAGKKG
ncbi:MAG: 50S ribosomal protein L3 [Planctomycetes bacterium]|nr:50S ribosomal protein L3 [Planctomycetota bacterium]